MVAVPADTNPRDDPDDLAVLERAGADLIDALAGSLPAWVEGVVAQRWSEWSDLDLPEEVARQAQALGVQVREGVVAELRDLFALDVDAQRTNPLSVIRRVVAPVTDLLREAGVAPVDRDAEAERLLPDDHYDLSPASFADLGPEVASCGVVWGAAKAHVVLQRRRTP